MNSQLAEVVFYLVVSISRGAVVIPEPMTEKACRAEAARINRPASEGGERDAHAICTRIERQRKA